MEDLINATNGLSALAGYLIGSVPFGLVLTRLAGLGDIRAIGSGNIGATNVLRTGNKKIALLTLLLDGVKGVLAVLLVWQILGQEQAGVAALVAGVAAVIGHNFPIWLKFKGGKGVATGLGVLLVFSPLVGASCCLVWLVAAGLFRYSSLSALLAFAAAPVLAWFLEGPDLSVAAGILCLLCWYRHSANIKRLISGTEPKIGAKKAG